MFKKILCLILCVCLLGAMATTVFADPEEKTLTISTLEELLAFAENCRLDTYSENLTVSLQADIDLKDTDFVSIPVFSGTFLGNGHMVSGLKINENGSNQGFFRYLTQTARVEKLNISGQVTPGGSRSDIGGIAGCNAGLIFDCSFSGTVTGRDRVGGIAGTNTVTGIIDTCRTSGTVTGNHFTGGIAGDNAGVIRYCENTAGVNDDGKQDRVELSDITLETVTGTEAATTVTDMGGIAGCSSGVIRSCYNYGPIGYPHVGYNVGGIAGSLTGHINSCENYSSVSGRKEVGGIAGQMEPAVLLEYETDTIQMLESQLSGLGSVVDRLSGNLRSTTNQIKSCVNRIQNSITEAREAIENLSATDPDSALAALQVLSSSLSGIENGVRDLFQATENASSQLESDLQALESQMNQIRGTLADGDANLGGSVADISDADTPEDLTGKVSVSINYGQIVGDRNIGGIAGAMAIETDLDPEEDIAISGNMTLNAAGKLRSVILQCENYGDISGRKQNAGGIVGWQSMGLVKACISINKIDADTANYAGGIAGQSNGYIRNCSTKSVITAKDYVGGIAGSGTVVTDCTSVSSVTGSECVGGILGFAEDTDIQQPILANVYAVLNKDPGGIDGINYSGIAMPMAWEDLIAQEGLPEDFQKVTVTFQFADGTIKTVSLTAGSSLQADDVPVIPAQNGQLGRWDGVEAYIDQPILLDMTFTAVYAGHNSVLASEELRDGKPVLLLQGDFSADSVLTTKLMEQLTPPQEDAVLLDALHFTVTESTDITSARYLLPATDKDGWQIYVLDKDGAWRPVSYTVEGSYVVFPVGANDAGFAVWSEPGNILPWIVAGATAVVLAAGVVLILILRKKKKA